MAATAMQQCHGSAKWKWLKKSTGGGIGGSGSGGMAATLPYNIMAAQNGSGCKKEKANNQLNVTEVLCANYFYFKTFIVIVFKTCAGYCIDHSNTIILPS